MLYWSNVKSFFIKYNIKTSTAKIFIHNRYLRIKLHVDGFTNNFHEIRKLFSVLQNIHLTENFIFCVVTKSRSFNRTKNLSEKGFEHYVESRDRWIILFLEKLTNLRRTKIIILQIHGMFHNTFGLISPITPSIKFILLKSFQYKWDMKSQKRCKHK